MKKAELEAEVARLQKILDDHYTGSCDRCGKVGLLKPEYNGYDEYNLVCLEDREGCEDRYEERLRIEREARQRNEGPLARAMKDFYNRTLLEQARADVLFSHLTAAHNEREPNS